MGLLSYFKERALLKQFTSTSYRRAVATAIGSKLDDTKLREHWTAEAIERLSGWLWQCAVQIEASPNPVATCREALVDQAIGRANFMTLLFQPDPASDPSGFTGTQGITGCLHSHIVEIARKDAEFHGTGLPDLEAR